MITVLFNTSLLVKHIIYLSNYGFTASYTGVADKIKFIYKSGEKE